MGIRSLVFLLISVATISHSTAQNELQHIFKILPSPQEFKITGSSELQASDVISYEAAVSLPKVGELYKTLKKVDKNGIIKVSISPNAKLKREGYELEIKSKTISINAIDNAGILYAFMTLEQLIQDAAERLIPLPKCVIKDYPALSYRSVQWDVKHHLEQTSYYYDLIDDLAKLKINAIIVELEDKIAYKKHPMIGSEDALSIEEWQKLANYAFERNIEMSPLVQGLGHVSFILKHDKYKALRDDPASDWAFNPLEPKTYELQFDLYDEAIQATPHGKYLHIGGDEVHTTGRNSGKSALELQLIWLNKVCQYAKEHDRTPIFWDDMPLKLAELYRPMFNNKLSKKEVDDIWEKNEGNLLKYLDMLPKNCIYMRWNYESPECYGNAKAMQWFLEHDLKVMGATAAQTRWSLMPRKESNMHNIRTFTLNSIDLGLNSLFLTMWDDDSPHFELYKRGIYAFAENTWSAGKRSVNETKEAFRHRHFSSYVSSNDYAFIDELEKQVAYWEDAFIKKGRRSGLLKMKNSGNDPIIEMPNPEKPGEWSKQNADRINGALSTIEKCENIGLTITRLKEAAIRNHYTLAVYEQVNEMVKFSAKTILSLKSYDEAKDKLQKQNELKRLNEEFVQKKQKLEDVYSFSRKLTKPANYILDQDHHNHMANQTLNFDWQFLPEIWLFEKINQTLLKEALVN